MALDLASTKARLESLQHSRRHAKVTFLRIMCKLNVALGQTTNGGGQQDPVAAAHANSACDDDCMLDADDLLLTLEVPTASHCTDDQDPAVLVYPSQTNHDMCSAWKMQEYQDWGTDYTAPTTCQITCAVNPPPPLGFTLLASSAHANEQVRVGENIGLLRMDDGRAATGLLEMEQTQTQTCLQDTTALAPLIANSAKIFTAQLESEHQSDIAYWAAESARQVQCHMTAANKFQEGGEVFVEKQEFNKRKVKLQSCHAVDKAWNDYKDARQCEVPQTTLPFAETLVHYATLGGVVEVLASKLSTYDSALGASTDLPASCIQHQVDLEDQMCFLRRVHRLICKDQDECTMALDLASIKARLESLQHSRRHAKVTFLRIMCKLNVALGQTTNGGGQQDPVAAAHANSACDDCMLDADDLLTTLEMPTASHCADGHDPAVLVYPSQTNHDMCSAWKMQEYQDWGTDYTAPTTCQITCAVNPPPLG